MVETVRIHVCPSTVSAVDALTSLLDGPRGRGAFLRRTIMEPPWAVRIQDEAPIGVIAMLRGDSWVVPDKGDAVQLGPGAVATVKGPDAFTLADSPGTPPQVVIRPGRFTTPHGDDLGATMDLGVRTWGNDRDGSDESLIGCYQMRGEISRRVLDALPTVFALTPDTWSSPLIPLLGEEVAKDEPGQQAVLDRMFDLLLIAVIRAWFAQPEADAPAWYRAHRDPGHALRLIHSDPAQPWTVGRLAAAAGISRALFARRFTELVGEAPMNYLTGWRLALAADLLQEPDSTLDVVAHRVGCSNGFALSTAFKRVRGISPQEHRRNSTTV